MSIKDFFEKFKKIDKKAIIRLLLEKVKRRLSGKIIRFLFGKHQQNKIILKSQTYMDGSCKYMFEYMLKHRYNEIYKIVYLIPKEKEIPRIKEKNVFFVRDRSMQADYHIATAKVIFFEDQSVHNFMIDSKKYVYLTHGTPLKNVKGKIVISNTSNVLVCSSSNMVQICREQFSAVSEEVIISNRPIVDRLFIKDYSVLDSIAVNSKDNCKIVVWMPTFRKNKSNGYLRADSQKEYDFGIPILNSQNMSRINEYLKQTNILLLLKLHPHHFSEKEIENYSNIKVIKHSHLIEKNIDIYSILAISDALITDYSSVHYDYMLLNKPIAYILDDFKEYKLGFAFENALEYMPGHHIYDEEQFLSFFDDLQKDYDKYAKKRKHVCDFVHKFKDGENTKRCLEAMEIVL